MSTPKIVSVTDGMQQILDQRNVGLSLVPLSDVRLIPRAEETVNLDGENFEVERVSYYFRSENGSDESELASIAVRVTRIERAR